MQIILSGLHGDACEESITQGLSRFFQVKNVHMVQEGALDSPWAVIEVSNSYEHVWEVCNKLRGIFHRGKRLHFYIPLHQTDAWHDLAPHQRVDIG